MTTMHLPRRVRPSHAPPLLAALPVIPHGIILVLAVPVRIRILASSSARLRRHPPVKAQRITEGESFF